MKHEDCCHYVGQEAFPNICVGVPDDQCCEPHPKDRSFPPALADKEPT